MRAPPITATGPAADRIARIYELACEIKRQCEAAGLVSGDDGPEVLDLEALAKVTIARSRARSAARGRR